MTFHTKRSETITYALSWNKTNTISSQFPMENANKQKCTCISLTTTEKLQLVYNVDAHTLMGTARYQHVNLISKELHWFPVVFQAQCKWLVLLTYKALTGLVPGYLKACLRLQVSVQSVWSSGERERAFFTDHHNW